MTEPNSETINPSSASRPDLDWSQVRETIMMLGLAVAQTEVAMHDSASSVGSLTESFTSMSDTLKNIIDVAGRLPDDGADGNIKAEILRDGAEASDAVGQAIIAFQFYDRLSQRLAHVCSSLEDLSALVSQPASLYNPFAWAELQKKIRSKYTMEEEKLMFDTMLQTGSIRLAITQFLERRHQQASATNSDVELF